MQQILKIMLKCEILKYCWELGLIMFWKDVKSWEVKEFQYAGIWGADMQRPEHYHVLRNPEYGDRGQ
jgi:hypothetical protein